MAEESFPIEQDVALGRFGAGLSAAISGVASRLHFSDRNRLKRITAISFLCILPLALAISNLPEAEPLRVRVAETAGSVVAGAIFNSYAGLIASTFALFAAICMNRGWAHSEQVREEYVTQGGRDGDAMPPDLRGSALLSAVVIVLTAPLILFYLNQLACRFSASGCPFMGPTDRSGPWLATAADFTLQTATFSIFQEVFRYPNFSSVLPVGEFGRLVEIFLRLLLQIVFIGALFEIFRIHRTIAVAVSKLRDLDHVERLRPNAPLLQLGARAVPQLRTALRRSVGLAEQVREDGRLKPFAHNAANALGQIGDLGAVPILKQIFRRRSLGARPRERAVVALAALARNIREKADSGGLRAIWYRFALFRLALWARFWIWRETAYAKRKHSRITLIRNGLDQLIAAASRATKEA